MSAFQFTFDDVINVNQKLINGRCGFNHGVGVGAMPSFSAHKKYRLINEDLAHLPFDPAEIEKNASEALDAYLNLYKKNKGKL